MNKLLLIIVFVLCMVGGIANSLALVGGEAEKVMANGDILHLKNMENGDYRLFMLYKEKLYLCYSHKNSSLPELLHSCYFTSYEGDK